MLSFLLALSQPVDPDAATSGGVPEPDSVQVSWIDWEAPPPCPDAAQVRAEIEHRLGRPLAPQELTLRGRIESGGPGYVLELQTTVADRRDTRTLEAADCRTVVEAAALVSALSIDPVQTAITVLETRAPEPSLSPLPEPSTVTLTATDPMPVSERASTRTGDRRARPTTAAALRGGVSLGATPRPGAIVSVGIAVLWSRFGLSLGGHYVTPSVRTGQAGAVRVQMGAADLRACARMQKRRVDVPVCGGFEIGAVRGEGRRTPSPRTRHGLWVAPLVSADLWGWVHRRIALGLSAEAAIPVVSAAFELRDPGPAVGLFTPWPVAIRVLGGLRVALSGP